MRFALRCVARTNSTRTLCGEAKYLSDPEREKMAIQHEKDSWVSIDTTCVMTVVVCLKSGPHLS